MTNLKTRSSRGSSGQARSRYIAAKELIRRLTAAVAIAAASLAAMLVLAPGEDTEQALAAGATLSLDMEISNGACVDIDSTVNVAANSTVRIALCLDNPGTVPVVGFEYRVIYNDLLVDVPEVNNAGKALDDNPDANTGSTTFSSPHLGSGWDCSGESDLYPVGDELPATGPGNGRAYSGACASPFGPVTLLDGPLGVITTTSLVGSGSSTSLSISGTYVIDNDLNEIGSCAPVQAVSMTCVGGTITNNTGSCTGAGDADDELRANGPNVPDVNDVTWPNSDSLLNSCDSDDDNDGISDVIEDGTTGCGGDSLDMDTDNDHLLDGWECANGSNPNDPLSKALGAASAADNDADRVPDLWEMRGYNSSPSSTDTDGSCSDLVEITSVDGNRAVADADRLSVARRVFNIWPPNADQDWVLDVNANGSVDDGDRLFVARAAILPDWQPKLCP